jgi:rubrerythrin
MIELIPAIVGLKNAADLANFIQKANTKVEINNAALQISGIAIQAQTALALANGKIADLTEEKRALEAKIVQFERWDAEKERYELKAVRQGVFVYLIKPECQGAEPLHWICPNCYERRQKSILQAAQKAGVMNHSVCPSCKAVFDVHFPGRP